MTLLTWCVKGVFRLRVYTNNMPLHPPVPNKGLGDTTTIIKSAIEPVGRNYQSIVSILDHVHHHTFCEDL